uniref:Transposase (Putative), gypsy type n=1 Tax=Tanacetum cinerariifolium TaxID=118510 RepID=A0A6L2KEY6_TANCI|nr:hypothetical protein [Tanacetum cinerariifolium]
MDLFAFIRHFDHTKVRIRKREPAEREVKLLTLIEGRTIPLNPSILATSGDSGDSIDKLFDEGNDDVLEETVAKDVSKVNAEKTKKKQKRKVVGDASGSTFPPKKLREDHHAAASNTRGKSLAAIRDLVSDGFSISSGVTDPLIVVFRATSFVADVPVMTVSVTTTVTVNVFAVPPLKVRVVSKNLEIFGDSAFAGGANTDATERDTEIAHLKSLLSLKEAEAAKAIRLRSQISAIEAADAAKGDELRDLKERNIFCWTSLPLTCLAFNCRDELSSKVASLESERDSFVGQKSSLESAFEFLESAWRPWQAIGCAVNKGILDGLRAGVDHGKARRDFSVIKAYDPFVEAKYVEAVNALGTVDFSLLFELKSKKDSSIVGLMDSLRLEGHLAEIPIAKDLQPSP